MSRVSAKFRQDDQGQQSPDFIKLKEKIAADKTHSENFVVLALELRNLKNSNNFANEAQLFARIEKYFVNVEKDDAAVAISVMKDLQLRYHGSINSAVILSFFEMQLQSLGDNFQDLEIAGKMLHELCNCGFSAENFAESSKKAIDLLIGNLNAKLTYHLKNYGLNSGLAKIATHALSHIKNLGLLEFCDEKNLNRLFENIVKIAQPSHFTDIDLSALYHVGTYVEKVLHKKLPPQFKQFIDKNKTNTEPRPSLTQKDIFDHLTEYLRHGAIAVEGKKRVTPDEGWQYHEKLKRHQVIRQLAQGEYFVALDQKFGDPTYDFADIVVFRTTMESQEPEALAVIEVDGPHHYTFIDGKEVETGRTKARNRLRQSLGTRFIKIGKDELQDFQTYGRAAVRFSSMDLLRAIRDELATSSALEEEEVAQQLHELDLSSSKPVKLDEENAASVPAAASAAIEIPSAVEAVRKKKKKRHNSTSSQGSSASASSTPPAVFKALTPPKGDSIVKQKEWLNKFLQDPHFDFFILKDFLEKYPYETHFELYERAFIKRGSEEIDPESVRHLTLLQFAAETANLELFFLLLRNNFPSHVIEAVDDPKVHFPIGKIEALAIISILQKFGLKEIKNQTAITTLKKEAKYLNTVVAVVQANYKHALESITKGLKHKGNLAEVIIKISALHDINALQILERAADHQSYEVLQFILLKLDFANLTEYVSSRVDHAFPAAADMLEGTRKLASSLLTIATARNDREVIDFLMKKGAAINSLNVRGSTTLIQAASFCDLETVRYLVEVCGADVNFPADDGRSPLVAACMEGKVDVAEYLLSKGANFEVLVLDAAGRRRKSDAMIAAAQEGQIEIVKMFLRQGYPIDHCSESGASLLQIAAFAEKKDMVAYLCQNGANIYSRENPQATMAREEINGLTALEEGLLTNNPEIIAEFQKLHPDQAQIDPLDGMNLFLKICRLGAYNALDSFKFTSEEMHQTDARGYNAFHLAALSHDAQTITKLFNLFVREFGLEAAQTMMAARNEQEEKHRDSFDLARDGKFIHTISFITKNARVTDLLQKESNKLYLLNFWLQEPIYLQNQEKLEQVIAHNPDWVNTPYEPTPGSGTFVTPLYLAVFYYRNKDLTKFLCEHGANPDITCVVDGIETNLMNNLEQVFENRRDSQCLEFLDIIRGSTMRRLETPTAAALSVREQNRMQ